MLEPYAVKVACTVLRGERSREAPDLPGVRQAKLGAQKLGPGLTLNICVTCETPAVRSSREQHSCRGPRRNTGDRARTGARHQSPR